jgi:hypothetical protein
VQVKKISHGREKAETNLASAGLTAWLDSLRHGLSWSGYCFFAK